MLLRGTDPQGLTDYVAWDPGLGPITDAEALAESLRFYRTAHALRLDVAHDAAGSALVSGAPDPTLLP